MAFNRSAGKVFRYGKDGDKEVSFKVQRVPQDKSKEITFRHFGRNRSSTVTKEGERFTMDMEAAYQVSLERAVFALQDSINCSVAAADQDSAEIYTKLLGTPVKVGEVVCLDGRWTPELKRQFLADEPSVATWVLERAAEIGIQAEEIEAGKA